jgi:hypothetical protein
MLAIYTTRWRHQNSHFFQKKTIKLCSFSKTERIDGSGILS